MTKQVLKPLAAVLTVVALAGCASSGSNSTVAAAPTSAGGELASSPTIATDLALPVADAASNKEATQHEAGRLLSLAVVPPGAVRTPTTPSSSSDPLAYPAVGMPMVNSLVDLPRMWRVNLPFAQTNSWLKAHPPAGLKVADSAGPGGSPVVVAGTGYQAADSSAWVHAELEISTAQLSATSTLIRADGQAIWLDPVPYQDDESGHRIRLDAKGPCPQSDRQVSGVSNTGSDLKTRMVPTAMPTGGLICRYDGLNGHRFTLTRSTTLDQAGAGRIAAAAKHIQLSHILEGTHGCPMDDASHSLISLSYPGRPDVDLWYHRTGCSGVANGFIAAGSGDFYTVVPATEGTAPRR